MVVLVVVVRGMVVMIMTEDNGADADSDGGGYKQDGSDYGSGGDNSADHGDKDKN